MSRRSSLDDGELVERAKGGDRDAFADLVRGHQRLALHVAYVTCGSHADAEEAVQDAFVKAYGALDRFRTGAPFRPWLVTIVANEARNRRRSRQRRDAVTLQLRALAPIVTSASAEATAVAQSEVEQLLAAVARLPERERLVVGYRHLVGLSERETATVLGARVGTVKSRLSRGLERLRRDLGVDEEVTL